MCSRDGFCCLEAVWRCDLRSSFDISKLTISSSAPWHVWNLSSVCPRLSSFVLLIIQIENVTNGQFWILPVLLHGPSASSFILENCKERDRSIMTRTNSPSDLNLIKVSSLSLCIYIYIYVSYTYLCIRLYYICCIINIFVYTIYVV